MKLLDKEDIIAYNDFLKNHKRCNFSQSIEWANVKSAWTNEVILVEDKNKNIIGSLSVLIRKIPIFGTIMYSPRGPICDIHNKEVISQIKEGIYVLAKKYKAIIFKSDPDIKKSDIDFRNIVLDLGFKIKDDAKDFKDEIQPRFVFRLDIKDKTEENLLGNFHSKTRYNIRLAEKKGVLVKEGTREDLKVFHKIMITTGARDNFVIRPLEYFERMYDSLNNNHFKLLMAYYEDKPISGIITINYGNKIWYLYGASSNEYRNLMPNYLLQWTSIKEALQEKKDIYDFRGVSGIVDETHPQYGLYRFKKGFGAEFTEFIGEIYINFKPVTYKMFKITEKIYKKLTMKIRKR